MKKYRIKQVGDKFYPQHKKFFGWGYYGGKPYMDYGTMSFLSGQKEVFYENLYFDSFEKANKFLLEEKKSNAIAYHDIKEEVKN